MSGLALGVNFNGDKELLGLWVAQTEGAKFWPRVVTELKNRGAQDIFIPCVAGLKGFPETIEAAYPKTAVERCIAHVVRHSLNFVSWKVRKALAADLRTICKAATVEEGEFRLAQFDAKWCADYAAIVQS